MHGLKLNEAEPKTVLRLTLLALWVHALAGWPEVRF